MRLASVPAGTETVLTGPALDFVETLARRFDPERKRLLARRHERQRELDRGQPFRFLEETAQLRGGEIGRAHV